MYIRVGWFRQKCLKWADTQGASSFLTNLKNATQILGHSHSNLGAPPLLYYYSTIKKAEINFINKKVKNSKIWAHFVIAVLKVQKTKWCQNFNFLTSIFQPYIVNWPNIIRAGLLDLNGSGPKFGWYSFSWSKRNLPPECQLISSTFAKINPA